MLLVTKGKKTFDSLTRGDGYLPYVTLWLRSTCLEVICPILRTRPSAESDWVMELPRSEWIPSSVQDSQHHI